MVHEPTSLSCKGGRLVLLAVLLKSIEKGVLGAFLAAKQRSTQSHTEEQCTGWFRNARALSAAGAVQCKVIQNESASTTEAIKDKLINRSQDITEKRRVTA